MIHLKPTNPGYDPESDLIQKVAEALGYDLAAKECEDDSPDEKCPGCQIYAVVQMLKEHGERLYRKGFQHIIDAETPPVPDLIFGTPTMTDILPPTA